MSVNDALDSAGRVLREKPSEVLPIYLLGISSVAVVRVTPFLSAALVYIVLAYHGRTGEVAELLGDVDVDRLLDPGPGQQEPTDGLVEVFDLVLSTPGVVPVLAMSVVAVVLVSVLVNALVGAGRVHTVYSALQDGDGLRDGVAGAVEDYDSFVLLALLELFGVLAISGFAASLGGLVVLYFEGMVAAAVGVLLGLVWLTSVLMLHLVFLFAPQSVVVDDADAVEAVRGNLDFLKREPVDFLAYLAVAVVGVLVLGVFAGAFGAVGAETVTPLLAYVALLPALDLVKTDLYARHADGSEGSRGGYAGSSPDRMVEDGEGGGSGGYVEVDGSASSPFAPVRSALGRLEAELRRGWREMVSFCFERPWLLAASAVLFASSFVVGFRIADLYLGGFDSSIQGRLETVSPVGGFLNYSANNWTVAVASAYSGLALAVPTVFALAFNGAMLGGLVATEVALLDLVGFVLPHGVVEIPALLISGALGLYLGGVAWGFLRGSVDVEALAREVERAYLVLVGLAVLFVVAGMVEAFVSPYLLLG